MTAAIIFDCDGVLVDSEVLAQEVEMDLLSRIGLHYDRCEFSRRFLGLSNAAFWEALEADGWARLGRLITAEVRPSLVRRLRAAFDERLTEVPGAGDVVRAVRHPKAVASSSDGHVLSKKLDRVGLWEPFAPHVYSADQVTHAKPAPDLFLYASNQLGVAPDGCLVIEDSVNGVMAALAANMRVWGFLGGGHHDDGSAVRLLAAGAERIVADWPEAGSLFESL